MSIPTCLYIQWVNFAQSCALLVTPLTIAHQAALSMESSRHVYWSRLPFPSPGDLPDPGIEPASPALQGDSFPCEPLGKPSLYTMLCQFEIQISEHSIQMKGKYFLAPRGQKRQIPAVLRQSGRRKRGPPDRRWGYLWGECSPSPPPKAWLLAPSAPDSPGHRPVAAVGGGILGFPCGSAGKEFACNVGDLGSIPGLGRPQGEENCYPLPYSGLENPLDFIVHGVAKSWTEQLWLSRGKLGLPRWRW